MAATVQSSCKGNGSKCPKPLPSHSTSDSHRGCLWERNSVMIWGEGREEETHGVGGTGRASNLLLPCCLNQTFLFKARILEQTRAHLSPLLLSLPSSLPSSPTPTKCGFQRPEMGNSSGPACSCSQGERPGTFLSPTTVRSIFILPIFLSQLRAVIPLPPTCCTHKQFLVTTLSPAPRGTHI